MSLIHTTWATPQDQQLAGVPHSLGTSELGKTNTIKSVTSNSLLYALSIGYNEEYIEESVNTKFLS
jgi:hypothetical protein